jgi:hypothetical protein
MKSRIPFLFLCLFLLSLAVPVIAVAQPVTNPTRVTFTPSVDDAVVTRYEMGYFHTTLTTPFQVADLGRPSCSPTLCDLLIPVHPFFGSNLTAKVRAYGIDVTNGATVASQWSDPSNFFEFVPAPPSGVTPTR